MALGDVAEYGINRSIEFLASATAANSPPSGASAGIEVNNIRNSTGDVPAKISLMVHSTAGSGTMTCTLRIWGYHLAVGGWVPLGTGADGLTVTAKGVVNANAAIGETVANTIQHAQLLEYPGHFTRVYLEIVAIGGTSTAITGWLVVQN